MINMMINHWFQSLAKLIINLFLNYKLINHSKKSFKILRKDYIMIKKFKSLMSLNNINKII